MADTKFDIASRALTRVGGNPIASFDDGTVESTVAGQNYESKVLEALSRHRWRFAMDRRSLGTKLNDTPADKWAYAWQLPSDLITLVGVTRAGLKVEYDRYGDKIFTNEDADLVAEFVFRADESDWPPYFIELVTVELAAVFALALDRDKPLYDIFTASLGALWPAARLTDSQQQTTRRIAPSRLIAVRG